VKEQKCSVKDCRKQRGVTEPAPRRHGLRHDSTASATQRFAAREINLKLRMNSKSQRRVSVPVDMQSRLNCASS
jgi:hypothetical protein